MMMMYLEGGFSYDIVTTDYRLRSCTVLTIAFHVRIADRSAGVPQKPLEFQITRRSIQ